MWSKRIFTSACPHWGKAFLHSWFSPEAARKRELSYIRFNVIMHHTFRKCEGVMMQIAHNDYMAMPRRFPAPDIISSDIPLPAARCK